MNPLDPKSRSLIDEVVAADLPPPGLEDELLRSLHAKLSQPLPPTAAAAQRALTRSGGLPLASSAAVKLLIGAIGFIAIGSAAVHYTQEHGPQTAPSTGSIATTSQSAPSTVHEAPPPPARDGLTAADSSSLPASPLRAANGGRIEADSAGLHNAPLQAASDDFTAVGGDRALASPNMALPRAVTDSPSLHPGDEGADRVGSLAEETQLLAHAQRALQGGAPSEALRWIEAHTRRFPAGALAQERDAVRVFTLCALRRKSESRQAQQQYLRDWPASPLAKRVKDGCPKQ